MSDQQLPTNCRAQKLRSFGFETYLVKPICGLFQLQSLQLRDLNFPGSVTGACPSGHSGEHLWACPGVHCPQCVCHNAKICELMVSAALSEADDCEDSLVVDIPLASPSMWLMLLHLTAACADVLDLPAAKDQDRCWYSPSLTSYHCMPLLKDRPSNFPCRWCLEAKRVLRHELDVCAVCFCILGHCACAFLLYLFVCIMFSKLDFVSGLCNFWTLYFCVSFWWRDGEM